MLHKRVRSLTSHVLECCSLVHLFGLLILLPMSESQCFEDTAFSFFMEKKLETKRSFAAPSLERAALFDVAWRS
jgi:hypothetical protein